MDPEAAKLAAADAARLRECDGPHMRAWAREDRAGFVAAVHRVADLALAPCEPEPAAYPSSDPTAGRVMRRISSPRSRT